MCRKCTSYKRNSGKSVKKHASITLNFKPVLVILHSEGLTDQESQNEVFGLEINIVHYIKVTVNLLKKWLNTGILPLVFL